MLLHWPLARHWDWEAPSRRKPGLHWNLATSLRLNWEPWVSPLGGLPGWPQVMAASTKRKCYSVYSRKKKRIIHREKSSGGGRE